MEVTCIEQNPGPSYASLVLQSRRGKAREVQDQGSRIKNQDTPRSGRKQFTCSKSIYFFRSFLGPFTVPYLACGGFTRRVAYFALRRCWRRPRLCLPFSG